MSVDAVKAEQKFVAGAGVSLQLSEYTENGRVFRNWKFQRIKGKAVEEAKEEKSSKTRESRKKREEKRKKEKEEGERLKKEVERKRKEDDEKKKEGEKEEKSKVRRRSSPLARRNKQLRVEEEERREVTEEIERAKKASKELIEAEAKSYKDRRRTLPSGEVDKSLSEKRKAKKSEKKASECDLDKELAMEQLLKMYKELSLKVEAMEKAQNTSDSAKKSPEVAEIREELGETLNHLTFKYQKLTNIVGQDENGGAQLTQLQAMSEEFSQKRG